MSTQELTYGHVNSEADLRQVFAEIRGDVAAASSRDELTQLYRRAEYLITLTYAPAWQKKFGDRVEALRRTAEAEFSRSPALSTSVPPRSAPRPTTTRPGTATDDRHHHYRINQRRSVVADRGCAGDAD